MASSGAIKAGEAYYQLVARDETGPALEKARAGVQRAGALLRKVYATVSPGQAGTGLVNRVLFGRQEIDAITGKYLGRVGGIVGTLRATFDPGARGEGLLNRAIYGTKQFDQKTGAFTGRVGGIAGALKAAAGAAAKFGEKLSQVGGAALQAGGSLAALGAGAVGLFKGGFDRGAELAQLNRSLGVPIETLAKLKYAADSAGVSLDEVMQDTTGRYRDLIADAPAADVASIRAAGEAQRQLSEAIRSVQDAALPLAQTLAPILKSVADWTKQNQHLIAPLLAVGVGAAAVGTALVGLAGAASFAGSAWLALKGIVAGVAAAVTSPLGLITAGVAAAGYAWVRYTDSGKRAAEVVGRDLTAAANTARQAYEGIGKALMKGDVGQAADVAAAAVELAWAGLNKRLMDLWDDTTGAIGDAWTDLTAGLSEPLKELWGEVKRVAGGIKQAFAEAGQWVARQFDAVAGAVEKVWEAVREPVMRVAKALAPVFAVIAAPVVAAVKLIEAAWDGLSLNLRTTMINFRSFVGKTWETIAEAAEIAFARVVGAITDTITTGLKAALDVARKILNEIKDFVPGNKVENWIAQLDAAKGAIGAAANVDDQVKKIEADRKKNRDDIEAERVAAVTKVQVQIAAEKTEAAGKRDAKKVDRAADVDAAQAKFDAAVKAAEAAAPNRPGGNDFPLKRELLGDFSVKGGFAGDAAAQQFGYADQAAKMNELMRQLYLDQRDKLPQKIGAEVGKAVAPLGAPPKVK